MLVLSPNRNCMRQADKYNVPRMIFVNKMDKVGADFYRSVEMVQERLGARPLVLQIQYIRVCFERCCRLN